MDNELAYGVGYADDLTSHMIHGLVDRFLEYGYLPHLCQLSDRAESMYTRMWRDGQDILTVNTVQEFVEFRFTNHDVMELSYSITCHINSLLVVTDVSVMAQGGMLVDAANHFHQLLRNYIASVDTFGNARVVKQS